MKDLFIAIPTKDNIVAGLIPKLIRWAKDGAEVCVIQTSPLVDYARNTLVRQFLKGDKEYLLFIDSDTIPEVDGPMRLKVAKKEIISGTYNLLVNDKNGAAIRPSAFTMFFDGKPITEAVSVIPHTGIVKCAILSTGFLLIHRDVFSKVKEPWFDYKWLDTIHDAYYGEDVNFSFKCTDAGITLWCDTDTHALHCKQVLI